MVATLVLSLCASRIGAETAPMVDQRDGGYPKTIVDSLGNTYKFYKPVRRVIPLGVNAFEALRTLKATDLVVGADRFVVNETFYFPGFQNLCNVGQRWGVNFEAVLSCNPDLIITSTNIKPSSLEDKLIGTGIAIVRYDFNNLETHVSEMESLAYLLEKEDAANEYLKFFHAKVDKIKSMIDQIPVNERPSVYLESAYSDGQNYRTCGVGCLFHNLLAEAGGVNIFADIDFYAEISPEAVLSKNPSIIIKYKYPDGHINRDKNDTKDLEAVREEILTRSELRNIDAIKEKRVYVFDWYSTRGGALYFLCLAQMAKWFYPDRFKDFHPRDDYDEYLRKFQGLDIDLNKYGVFFYPE